MFRILTANRNIRMEFDFTLSLSGIRAGLGSPKNRYGSLQLKMEHRLLLQYKLFTG